MRKLYQLTLTKSSNINTLAGVLHDKYFSYYSSRRRILALEFAFYPQPAKKLVQLISGQLHCRFLPSGRPWETAILKALEIQPETVASPFQYLQTVPVSVAEHEQCLAEQIQLEALFHDSGKPVYLLAHIR
jgi:hypothetical protein